MTATQLKEKLISIRSNVVTLAGEAMLENKEQIVGLVINQQQEQHVDSYTQPLRAYSTPYYNYKRLSGKSGETDFDDTGHMHSTMDLTIEGEQYIIDSPSQTNQGMLKSAFLREWQGSPVMDLTEDNKGVAWNIIAPTLVAKMREAI